MNLNRIWKLRFVFLVTLSFCEVTVHAEGDSIYRDQLGADVRLFTTHAERLQLDMVRQQSSMAAERTDVSAQRSTDRLVTYGGFIRNSGGATTIFADVEGEIRASSSEISSANVGDRGDITLDLDSGQSIQLKAGEGYRGKSSL